MSQLESEDVNGCRNVRPEGALEPEPSSRACMPGICTASGNSLIIQDRGDSREQEMGVTCIVPHALLSPTALSFLRTFKIVKPHLTDKKAEPPAA